MKLARLLHRAGGAAAIAALVLAAGCASVPAGGGPSSGGGAAAVAGTTVNPQDPWEALNRRVYAFNDAVDEAVLKPVATAYTRVVPQLVRTGVSNVLGNIQDVWSAANHLLQGKVQTGLEMGMRVLTNTLFGLGGLLDPATEMGLTRRSEDFGQTLGRWGVGAGPYLVLPFLGPSTVRDSAGLIVDRGSQSQALPLSSNQQTGLTAVEMVDLRAALLSTTKLLDDVALDRYSFMRDAYLARRRDAVYDGAPPLDTFDDVGDDPAPGTSEPAGASKKPATPPPDTRK